MQRNFHITQGVELNGDFGRLDIHNAYDFTGYGFVADGQVLRLHFRGNEWKCEGQPALVQIEFHRVSVLEINMTSRDLVELTIDEIGFKESSDRDYDWLSPKDEGDTHIVFRCVCDSTIRVFAETATVSVFDGRDAH